MIKPFAGFKKNQHLYISCSNRTVIKKRHAAMRAHRLHIAADFRRIVHALDHGEVAQYGEGDDVFIAQAHAEVVGAGNERQQRGQVFMQAGEQFVRAREVFRKIAVLRAFFRGVVGARGFCRKFWQADADAARREQFAAVFVHLVQPGLHFGADGLVQALAARVFIEVADDVKAFAHRRAVFFYQDGHHFFANETDGRRFVVVGERDLFDVEPAQADNHAGADAKGAVVVVVEFHMGLRLGVRFITYS